eukprot:14157230-Alexandrium_andersonii.AAC.1
MPVAHSALAGLGVTGTTSSPRDAAGWETARAPPAMLCALLRSRTVLQDSKRALGAVLAAPRASPSVR